MILAPEPGAAAPPPSEAGRGRARRVRTALVSPELALFALCFGVYAYFFQAGGWNQNSRFDLVRAVVEQGRLAIDDYVGNTGDYAYFAGHYYCDKAPLLSLLAVPVYAAVHPFAHGERPRGRLVHLGAYLSTLAGASLPSAAAAVLLLRTAVRLGAPMAAGALLAVSYAFATLAFPYATLFYAHQLSAGLVTAAFAMLVEARSRGAVAAWRLVAVGLLLGSAVVSEYPAALIVAVLAAYAGAVVRPWPRLGWVAAGALLPLLGLAVYHTVSFGGPFTVPYAGVADPNRRGGLWLGLSWPDPGILGKVLFSTERGLLHHTPWLAFAAAGLVRMVRGRSLRPEGLACLAAIVLGLAFNGALRGPDDWRGGAGVGTRYLVPWLPFFALAMVGLWVPPLGGWARRPAVRALGAVVVGGLVVISGTRMFLSTAIRPEIHRVDDPFAVYRDHWRRDEVAVSTVPFHSGNADAKHAWNLGERMGLRGRASLWPLAIYSVIAAGWLAATVKKSAVTACAGANARAGRPGPR
ncbi:MAG TPA: hypothetical protein VMR21_14935 [Vicinamibacteria bacterium]|nr:hypothetical protein [Vicinamibacteria bacterium]